MPQKKQSKKRTKKEKPDTRWAQDWVRVMQEAEAAGKAAYRKAIQPRHPHLVENL